MNTINYDNAQQLFEAVGTSLKKHTAEIADMNNVYGAKNLLPNNAVSQTLNGVTFTVNSDGSVTANGTASGAAYFSYRYLNLPEGKKIFSGCPNGGSSDTYYMAVFSDNGYAGIDNGKGVTITSNAFTGTYNARFEITVKAGVTVSNVIFKPMIRLASIEDDTYAPYAMTNQQLTGLYDNELEMGAVNELPNKLTSAVVNGVTATVNSDGSVSLNGTSSDITEFYIISRITHNYRPKSNRIRLTGCPQNGTNSTYSLQWNKTVNGQGSWGGCDYGNGIDMSLDSNVSNIGVWIHIESGVNTNGLIFKPMISDSKLNLSYNDYVPYAKSNKELTDDVTQLNDEIADITNILGAKNILRYPYYHTTRAESGMTLTDNGDGSITLSGTATARIVFRFADNAQTTPFTPPVGTYKLVVSGNSAGLYLNFDAYNNTTWLKNLAALQGNGTSASFDIDYVGFNRVTGYIDIPSGTAITTPITIKPMIIPAHVEDTTFVPYAKSNKELTDDISSLAARIKAIEDTKHLIWA